MGRVLCVLCAVVILFTVHHYSSKAVGNPSYSETDNTDEETEVKSTANGDGFTREDDRWSVLDLLDDDDGHNITSIELTISEKAVTEFRRRRDTRSSFTATSVVSKDGADLRIAASCFNWPECLRRVNPPGWRAGQSNIVIGDVTFRTIRHKFTVAISSAGFFIDPKKREFGTMFYSPAGADFLSMLYSK